MRSNPDLSLTRRRPTRLALSSRYLHYSISIRLITSSETFKAFISSILSLNSFLNMLSFKTNSILRTCSENIQKWNRCIVHCIEKLLRKLKIWKTCTGSLYKYVTLPNTSCWSYPKCRICSRYTWGWSILIRNCQWSRYISLFTRQARISTI